MAKLMLLTFWEIPEDYNLLFNHKPILLCWKDINQSLSQSNISRAIEWHIQGFIRNKN